MTKKKNSFIIMTADEVMRRLKLSPSGFHLMTEHSLGGQAAQLVFLWRRFLSLWLLVELVLL